MRYTAACYTQTGAGKSCNQDSLLVKKAVCGKEEIVLGVLCDGMGGLKRGEAASAALVKAFSGWFEEELPRLLSSVGRWDAIMHSWDILLRDMNLRLRAYGRRNLLELGTTASALLLTDAEYYIVHVGDGRIYEMTKDGICRLTKDQTLVEREVERGILTREQALHDVRRNVLLQCIGASSEVKPMYKKGSARPNTVYMLCCDGFWHAVSEEEIYHTLYGNQRPDEPVLRNCLKTLAGLGKIRGERDDISAVAFCAEPGEGDKC